MNIETARFQEAPNPLLYSLVYKAVYAFFERRGGINITGSGNQPKAGRVIVTAEHEKKIDGFAIGIAYPRAIRALAKKELWGQEYYYIVGRLIQPLGAVAIVRGSQAARPALDTSLGLLDEEVAFLSFLKGSRKEATPKGGVAWLALHSNSPVLPVGLSTANVRKGRPIQCVFGELIDFDGLGLTKAIREKKTAEIATSLHDVTQKALELDRDGAGLPGKIRWYD